MEPREFGEWIEKIGGKHPEPVLLQAREEYQTLTGQIFQDDKSYESRMGLFFEWFTVDRALPDSEMTPLEKFLADPLNAEENALTELKEIVAGNLHSLFQVTHSKPTELRVREMFEEKEYRVQDKDGGLFFNKNDLFEGRLISLTSSSFFSGNFIYHPPDAVKYIRSRIKAIQSEEKEAGKRFKAMEKDLAGLEKKKAANEKEVNRLISKIEKTKKVEKRESLEKEKNAVEENGRAIARDWQEANLQVRNFKAIQLGTELRNKRFELMQKLSYMSLKWERSRQIALTDIYKD